MLLVCSIFYLSFCIAFGVYLGPDSQDYIDMISAREPVYPLFLALVRSIASEKNWLAVVILLQNVLMILAVWRFTLWMKGFFHLSERICYVTLAFHFGVAALCQFAAGRASFYTNSILTEGITLSLWIFFVLLLLRALYTENLQYVAGAALLGALMMDTRKQMAVTFIILVLVLGLGWLGKKQYWKKMGLVLLLTVGSILLAIGGTRLYNYQLRGEFAQNTRDMNLVLTTTLYVANREDAQLIEEEPVRDLFVQVYDILETKECNYKFAGDGWKALEAHYGAHYDLITVDTTKDLFTENAVSRGFAPGLAAEQEADRMSAVIVKSLFFENAGTYAKVFFASMANGFINTVAKRGAALDVFALCMYLFYIAVMVMCFLHKSTQKVAMFGLVILLAILVNVGVTAALIFCQTRYMIYNMALFYTALVVMCYGLTYNKGTE